MHARQMFYRTFALVALLAVFLPRLSADAAEADSDRLNILWIIGEDLGPEQACYGTPQVWTPNIDALAAKGMRFTRAFTVTPVCSTSRSSFMTGMYAWTIGAHNHRSHRGDGHTLPDGVRLLTHWLRDTGYFTANIVQLSDDDGERYFRGTGKTDWNFSFNGEAFDSSKWSDLKKNQPFYAQINFPETHRGGAWDNAHKNIERTADPEKVVLPPYYPDHPVAREDWAQYLNTVMSLDHKVGYVLGKLKEDGLAANTVVVFMGDHGRAMIRGKQWPYDSGLHIPLVVYYPSGHEPGGYKAASVSDRLVASIDLTATALDIAGVAKPSKMQGRVLFGPNAAPPREYVFGGRDRGDETVDRIRTVRDARYRYIRNFYPERPFLQTNRYKDFQYPVIHVMRWLDERGRLTEPQKRLLAPSRPKEELYDTQKDPYEIENLADSPQHAAVLNRLRTVLHEHIESSNDQGRFPEPVEEIARWEERSKQNYDEKIERRVKQLHEEFERYEKK